MTKWKLKAKWKDETHIHNGGAELVYNIILDFASEEQALNFRLTFRDKNSYYYHSNDNPYDTKFEIISDKYSRQIELTDWELKDLKQGKNYFNKLPLNTTHFEFQITVNISYDPDVDNNGLEQKIKQQIKEELEQKHNAQVQIQFVPPKMHDLKDYKELPYKILDKKDTLFEGLSTNELKHYDFVIVGRDQQEVDKLDKIYIRYLNDRTYSAGAISYKTKEDIKKDDFYNKNGDMAYLKTKSDTLDSGIYCFTARARNYFSFYKDKMLLPVFLDAKASQLGGKVVVAKKENKMANKWTLKKAEHNLPLFNQEEYDKYINMSKENFEELKNFNSEDLENDDKKWRILLLVKGLNKYLPLAFEQQAHKQRMYK